MRIRQFEAFLIVIFILTFINTDKLLAQYVEISTNKQEEKDSVISTIDIEKLFSQNPALYYNQYLDSLVSKNKFKQAEKVILDNIKHNNNRADAVEYINLGYFNSKLGKESKAIEYYDKGLLMINGDDVLTQKIAKAFVDVGKIGYAISAYEKASNILMNQYIYCNILANLYAQDNRLDKAIEILLTRNPGFSSNIDNAKTILLQIIGDDKVKLQQAQKLIIAKINDQPNNVYFAEILTWIYTRKDDWDGALIQLEAIDERNNETGKRLIDFARNALVEKQYDIASKAYDDVIAKGPQKPLYFTAKGEKLSATLTKYKNDTGADKSRILDTLLKSYEDFINTAPISNFAQVPAEYALVEAQYAGNPEKAVDILQKAILLPNVRREQIGKMKLQMGDYYLLQGKIWDASLTYSQVDKEFKQDAMGEDARFRNAKLAYYRGDFDWAQRQLLILKSATSELIANDALYLSVLITENVEDSVKYPLCRFAAADLLLNQNKDKEATELLDSITKAFPKHPLIDDIMMLHAKIAQKHNDFSTAITWLLRIHKEYAEDVLADDALFKIAEIYQFCLQNKTKAKGFYEQLIIEYPGSTFTQVARQRLNEIKNSSIP